MAKDKNKRPTLQIKKRYCDMIVSGEKKEEYRSLDRYRLKYIYEWFALGIPLPASVKFRNGYHKKALTLIVEVTGIRIGTGREEWGAKKDVEYHVLELGRILFNGRL